LEARVESARRASEIHKRRTGRSLRVTEQDVVNEEMYEEEDDDLPLQYRRLTAHLNTGSSDFNRRLAAYLTNSVAMRSALDQAMSGAYPQPYGQTWQQNPQLMHQMQQGMFQQPMNLTMAQQNHMLPPQGMNRSPPSFRQAPYPQMPAQGYRAGIQHHHTMSADQAQFTKSHDITQRHQSDPVQVTGTPLAQTPSLSPTKRSPSSSSLSAMAQDESTEGSTKSSPTTVKAEPMMQMPQGQLSHPMTTGTWSPVQQMCFSPFTTQLPGDAQSFFNAGFGGNASFTPNLMQTPEKAAQPFYSYNPNAFNKPKNVHPSYDGMSQTLAPGALDTKQDEFNWPTPPSATTDGTSTPFNNAFNYSLDTNFNLDLSKASMPVTSPAILLDSGLVTPGENGWASFIDQSTWDEAA